MRKDNPINSFSYASLQTIKMAFPLFGSRFINAVNRLIAMLMIAQLGHDALAAGALITCLQTTFMVMGYAMFYSVGAYVGRTYGEGKYDQIGGIAHQGLILATCFGLPLIIIMLNVRSLLILFGQNVHIATITQQFFYGFIWGVFPALWIAVLNQFTTGVSKPRIVIICSITFLPIRILLSYAFLFGAFGFPRLGVIGVAYANAIVYWIWLFFILSYIFLKKSFQQYYFFRFQWPQSFGPLKKLFSIGWPISVQFGAELIAWSAMTLMMGWLNKTSLAAQQIVMQCEMVAMMVPLGFAQACAVLVGQAVGQKKTRMVRYYGYSGLLWGAGFMVFIALLYLLSPKLLVAMFVSVHARASASIVHLAILLLALNGFVQFFEAIRNILTGALRGFHDTKIPMWVGILVVWVIGIPLGYLFAFSLHWGGVGLYVAALLGAFIGAIILWKRFLNFIFSENRAFNH